MGTFGDRPRSRGKWRRIRRRIFQVTAIALCLFALLIISAFYAIKSEFVWRKFIFPQFFGPYWETTVEWDRFSPKVFPPGIQITNLLLHEPNDRGKVLLSVGEIDFDASWRTRPDDIELVDIDVENVTINYVQYAENDSNLSRVVRRLFEGKNPTETGTAVTASGELIPIIRTPARITIDGIALRFENRTDPQDVLSANYTSLDDIELDVGTPGSDDEGRMDKLFVMRSRGEIAISDKTLQHKSYLTWNMHVHDLGQFPNSELWLTVTAAPDQAAPQRLTLQFDLPLNRVPVRPAATPFQNVNLTLLPHFQAEPILELRDASFDPLSGALSGNFSIGTTSDELVDTIHAFLPAIYNERVDEFLSHRYIAVLLGEKGMPSTLNMQVHADGTGVFQYGIADSSERLPLLLQTSGKIQGRDFLLGSLEELRSLLPGADAFTVDEQSVRGDADLEWQLSLDQRAEEGSLKFLLTANPSGVDDDSVLASVALHDANDPQEPVRFNPFGSGVVDRVKARFQGNPLSYPSYVVLPEYEQIVRVISGRLLATLDALDELEMQDAVLVQRLEITDPGRLKPLLDPVFTDIQSAERGELEITTTRLGTRLPTEWNGRVLIDGIKLSDIEDKLSLSANADLVREGDRLYARDMTISTRRSSPDAAQPVVFEMSLATEGPRGEFGPLEPTVIDLRTGAASFTLRANTMRREIMEIILRIQTFNLSEQLAQPFYQRLMDVLGFQPHDPKASGLADIYLKGSVGPILRLSTLLEMRNVPVGSFLNLPPAVSRGTERFDARFEQSFSLDRRSELLRPDYFGLDLSPAGNPEPFARLRVEAAKDSAFSYPMLMEIARQEADQFGHGVLQRPKRLKDFAAGFFDRIDRLRGALRGEGGKVVLEFPGLELADWRETFVRTGVPIQSGNLDLYMTASLSRVDENILSAASGNFSISDLRFAGVPESIPTVSGKLHITEDSERLYINELETSLHLDPDFPPTDVRFSGFAVIDSLESDWRLDVSNVNGSAISVMEGMRTSGIAEAVVILESLPLPQLSRIAGVDGRIDLAFHGTSNPSGDHLTIDATQSGTNLIVFPHFLHPLNFRVDQSLDLVPGEKTTLRRLDGHLDEQGIPASLLSLTLSDPITFGHDVAADADATITIVARKDLADLRDRFADLPLPIVHRTIEGGLLRGNIEAVIPGGVIQSDAAKLRFLNVFDLGIDKLRFADYDQSYDARLTGRILNDDDAVRLEDAAFSVLVGDEAVGELTCDAQYEIPTSILRGAADMTAWKSLFLDALPDRFRRWTQQPDARLDARSQFLLNMITGNGSLDFALCADGLDLPPIDSADPDLSLPHPLHLDLAFTSEYDNPTSRVLVQDFHAQLVSSPIGQVPRFQIAGTDTPSIIEISQLGPIIYNVRHKRLATINPEGAGLEAIIGPVNIDEYRALLTRFLGIPLISGNLSGRGLVQSRGMAATRIDTAELTLDLTDGLWRQNTGEDLALNASMVMRGATRTDVLRADEISLRLHYPDDPLSSEDHVELRGFYEEQDQEKLAEVEVESDALSVDRVLGLVADVQEQRMRNRELSPSRDEAPSQPRRAQSEEILRYLESLDAEIYGDLRNVTFRDLVFPAIRLNAQAKGSRFHLRELYSRLLQGEITAHGDLDLTSASAPWNFDLSVDRLEALPWVNSFAPPAWRDQITGRLDADVVSKGLGLRLLDLQKSMEARAEISLAEGHVDNPTIRRVLGSDAPLSAQGQFMVRNNIARLDLTTPWNPARDIRFQAFARPVLPGKNDATYYRGLLDFRRTTIVGPRERRVSVDGKPVPLRQNLFGVLVDISGSLEEGSEPLIQVRTIRY